MNIEQLSLFPFESASQIQSIHDPCWDEITAPQQTKDNHWNPAHFGAAPHKVDDDGQLTIFYDDVDEPPDPDDYPNLDDYEQAWGEWETLVGAQVSTSTLATTVQTLVGAQVNTDTKKVAPQHDTHWVEKYWVERSGSKYWYYRYCWMVGRKKSRIYLGSANSAIAKTRKQMVERAIADGLTPAEISGLVRSWKSSSRTH